MDKKLHLHREQCTLTWAVKLKITEFSTNPHSLVRLYHVNDPSGCCRDTYRLQPRQLVTLSRIMCLLIDKSCAVSVKAICYWYEMEYGVSLRDGLARKSLGLLARAGYIDNNYALTNAFYLDLLGIQSKELHSNISGVLHS